MLHLEKHIPPWASALHIAMYAGFVIFLFVVYHIFSDGDFSLILSLSYALRLFAFGMTLAHLLMDHTCAGLSAKSLTLFAVVFISRFIGVYIYHGYLPLDRSGDFVPYFELASFVIACVLVGLMLTKYRKTYASTEDEFGRNFIPGVPHEAGILYLSVPCLVLALAFHPNLNHHYYTDICWTFSMYLDSMAVLPQLWMFRKSNKPVERWTGHFLFVLSVSRLCSFIFWIFSFHELGARKHSAPWEGYFIVLLEFIALLMLADYAYYWIQSQRSGTALNLSASAMV